VQLRDSDSKSFLHTLELTGITYKRLCPCPLDRTVIHNCIVLLLIVYVKVPEQFVVRCHDLSVAGGNHLQHPITKTESFANLGVMFLRCNFLMKSASVAGGYMRGFRNK
jgi:hypothetical protein